MKKTSKTQTSQQLMQNMKVNSSYQGWDYTNKFQKPKQTILTLPQCMPCQSTLKNMEQFSLTDSISNEPTKQSFYNKAPLTPINKHLIIIPDITKSISQHKEGSKLSIQLNEISIAFNKQNKRMQEALFQIRESTVKKQKERYLKSVSLSRSKKSHTSKKSSKSKFDKSIIKVLDFENKNPLKSSKFSKSKSQSIYRKEQQRIKSDQKCQSRIELMKTTPKCSNNFYYNLSNNFYQDQVKKPVNRTGLKKKNLNELMKQQKSMIKNFSNKLRIM